MFDRSLRGVIAAIYALLIIVGLGQVTARYVFNSSLPWSEELALILMVWMLFIAAGVAVQQRLHIGIDLLTGRLGDRAQRVVGVVTDLLSTVFVVALLYYGARITPLAMAQSSPALGVPMGYLYLAVPVGAAIMLINLVRNALAGRRPLPAAEEAVA